MLPRTQEDRRIRRRDLWRNCECSIGQNLAWVFFLAALVWTVLLALAAGRIYLTHAMPGGFLNWILDIQVRGTNDWPEPEFHTRAYYLVRFFALTIC